MPSLIRCQCANAFLEPHDVQTRTNVQAQIEGNGIRSLCYVEDSVSLVIMALQAPVLDQLVVKEVSGSAHIMILELSYVVSVNVDTETSLQRNGIDAMCQITS